MRRGLGEPGGVDQNVERVAVARPHRLAQRKQGGRVGDVGGQRGVTRPGKRRDKRGGGLVGSAGAVGDDHAGARAGEETSGRAADGAGAADDEHNTAVERSGHVSSPT